MTPPTPPSIWSRFRNLFRLEVLIGFYLVAAGLILVPALLWVEDTIAEALVVQKIAEIKKADQNVVQLLSVRIETAEASIQRFAQLLSHGVQPPQPSHIAEFNRLVKQDPDGAWRSDAAHFNPAIDAGIWVPRIGVLNDDLKSFYIQAKSLTEQFGNGALNPTFVDTWILPATNGEVVFWPGVPDFIYSAGPDFDYTGTDWVGLVRPEVNPAGRPAWTPTSFDPVAAIWMISVIAPYSYLEEWAGSVGHDMPVGNLFSSSGALSQIEGSRFFLFAADETLMISDRYQKEIEQAQGTLKITDTPEAELKEVFPELVRQMAQAPLGEVVQLETEHEVLMASRVSGPGWLVVNAIPRTAIAALIRQPFSLLRWVVLLALSVMLVASVFSIGQEGLRRRRREQEIRQMNTELEQRVTERTMELAQRVEQLNLINRVVRSATALLDQDTLLPTLAALLRDAFDYYAVLVLLIDRTAGTVRLRAAATAGTEPLVIGDALPIDETSMIGYVAKTGQPLSAGDVRLDSRYHYHHKLPRTKSELVLPLRIGSEVVGVLDLESTERDAFSTDDAQVLQTLADQIAITIHNVGLFEDAQASRLDAEKANRAKSDFLANMSHELRTPLNGILGYAQILKRHKNLTPQQNEGLDVIYKSGDHLLTLINDVLDLAKIEAQKFELVPITFNLAVFLQSVEGIIRNRADQKDLTFTVERATALPSGVFADEKRLRQVVLNLLSNAVKFTDQGTVTLRVGVVNAAGEYIEPQPNPTTCRLRFEVRDTGAGMSPTALGRLFKAFEQVGGAKQRAEGTGLGLAISQKLVSAMGGTIQVASDLGQGSTFWFELELATEQVASSNEAERLDTICGYIGPRRKILIVDDKEYNRAVLSNLLTPLGFEIAEAENGRIGVEQAQAFRPDLIFMDVVMPEMPGDEATRLIRQKPELKAVVIIAASASAFDEDRQRALMSGCDDFVAKPINAHELFRALAKHLKVQWEYDARETHLEATPGHAAEFIPPPANEIAVLYDLAMSGNISDIKQRAAHLETLGDQYRPFAAKLRELVKNFDSEGIEKLIAKYHSS